MLSRTDLLLTAIAPAIWGSTYLVTTELLPDGYPLTIAMLRALPAGLLLLVVVRQIPPSRLLGKIVILGALNFSIFWSLLFVAAYHLPGGVAATIGAVQPLIVIFLAHRVLKTQIRTSSIVAAIVGMGGVALLVLTPMARLNAIGIAAGLGGALSMAAGTVLSRKWQPPVSPLTFAAWQLTAGGLLLLPLSFWIEPPLPALSTDNLLGLAYLGLIGAAVTYIIWFRGVGRIEPSVISTLGFLSPLTALTLGWWVLNQSLSLVQIAGFAAVLMSVWLSQWNPSTHTASPTQRA